MTIPSTPKSSGEIPNEIVTLSNEVFELETGIEHAYNRLSTVSTISTLASNVETPRVSASSSKCLTTIGVELQALNARIARCNEQLRALLNSIEL